MLLKKIGKVLAVITLVLAMGYSLYSSGLGEWLTGGKDGQKGGKERATEDGAPQNASSQGRSGDENVRLTVKEFSRKVRGEDSGKTETSISGEKAVLRKDNLYRIFSPVIVSLAKELAEEGDVDVEMNNVRLTADHAIFDEDESRIELKNSVRATGDDFVITTESVTYEADEQKAHGSRPVRLERYRKTEDGEKEQTMVVTGTGLRGDLVVSSVQLQKDVKAVLMNVSQEFMASGSSEETAETGKEAGKRTIVIRSEGPMIYEDGARQVTFKKNVRLTSEGKRLRAEKVVIQLVKKDKGGMKVEGLTAHEKVKLSFENKEATGDTLVWKNVTQAGVLNGKPAQLDTPRFTVEGKELTFVRLDNRFQVKGAGKLVRKPGEKQAREAAEDPEGMQFSEGSPITVTWKEGMTYDSGAREASFRKNVLVQQEQTKIKCDSMDMLFDDSGNKVQKITSTGSVEITGGKGSKKRHARCHRAIWKGDERAVILKAKEGEQVEVKSAREKLYSSTVSYLPGSDRLECPVAGKIILLEREEENKERSPMVVTWKSFMLYERSTGSQAVFQGDVHVEQTGRDLSARFLRVMFNAKQEPVQVIASGDARLQVEGAPEVGRETDKAGEKKEKGENIENWHLTSDRIEGYLQEDRVKAAGPGKLFIKRTKSDGDWIKWKDRMRANFGKSYAEFYGKVRSSFGGAKLDSEKLRLDFNARRELRHLNAKGKVRFVSTGKQAWKMKAEFAEAIFAPGSVLSQIIARDNVVVRDKNRRLKSEFLILFFQEQSGGKGQGQSLKRALARRNVRVRYQGEDEGEEKLRASCDRLDWDAESDKYRLKGDPAELEKGKMQMDGENIIVDRGSGHVSLPGGDTPASTSVKE